MKKKDSSMGGDLQEKLRPEPSLKGDDLITEKLADYCTVQGSTKDDDAIQDLKKMQAQIQNQITEMQEVFLNKLDQMKKTNKLMNKAQDPPSLPEYKGSPQRVTVL